MVPEGFGCLCSVEGEGGCPQIEDALGVR